MDDLLNEFLNETNDSLVKLDQQFVELEQNPNDPEIIGGLFRVMHTIKGTSGFLSFTRLGGIAHAAENLMDKVRNQEIPVTPDLINIILKATDKIREIVEHIAENQSEPEGDDGELKNEINEFANNGGAGAKENSSPKKNKTPDLDEEIDFDPIPAPYTDDKDFKTDNSVEAEKKLKTPDLDEEIDFDPIPAPYADDKNFKTDTPLLPAKTDAEQQKKNAVDSGIKAVEKSENQNKSSVQLQSIRVNLDTLEGLMQLVGELVLTRNQIIQTLRNTNSEISGVFNASVQRLNIITSELQEGVMKTRMQSIGSAWQKFPRLIRDLSNDLGKKITLKMEGEDTEIDRQMLEAIKDPLMHMVRNAADHGIEKIDERKKALKPEEGVVKLSAYHEGGQIVIKISDDGKGLNVESIKKKAIEKGLIRPEELETLSDKQIFQFIFKPGFSTAEKVTSVSGRGVGMDVVQSNIKNIGGTVEINSAYGKGSEFLIKLPLTLAIMPVLIFSTSKQSFAIPQIWISEVVRIENKNSKIIRLNRDESKVHKIEIINNSPVLRLRGKLIPIVNLSKTLRLAEDTDMIENYVIVCELGSSKFGIFVDKVFHTEEIVIKPKSNLIKNIEVFSGSTILGNGSVILILDPAGILKTLEVSNVSDNNN
ncbi:MAG TPA: hybrid sensor histidine kinase/response regulator, partial [Alphaproteobacteria bacterium]|nr:hybrid sensor histidine kinase/response regulator [Alphaproteobacteria bacterium]